MVSLRNLDHEGIDEVHWREFEDYCGQVLAENGYRAQRNVWFSTPERRYQIDVVGIGLGRAICVDCKAWKVGGGTSRARTAAREQKERTVQFKRHGYPRDGKRRKETRFYPLIVTLKSEEVVLDEGVAVVPFQGLNRFIFDFYAYEPELFCV